MAAQGEDVYCTLVMNDAYLPGAAVLAHSLRDAGTTKKLAAMITLDTLSADAVAELEKLYDILIPVERIVNPNPGNLFLMDRSDLLFAFTKIALWRQTQFRRIVYLDADVVALRAVDELFSIDAPFAAAPDIGWPDCFNTGLMVVTPNMGDYWALETLAASGDSFDGADQGLLNQYYGHKPWHRLSYTYNCTPSAEYQWEPAYRHYKSDIRLIHFIGKDKPWMKGRHGMHASGIYRELLGRWWAVYDCHLKPTQEFVPGRSFALPSTTIRTHVAGEATDAYGGTAPEEQIPLPPPTEIAPVFRQPQPEAPPLGLPQRGPPPGPPPGPSSGLPRPGLPQTTIPQTVVPQPGPPQPGAPQPGPPPPGPSQPGLPYPSLPHPSLPQSSLPQPILSRPSLPRPSLPQSSLPQPTLPQPTSPQPTLPQPTLPQPTLPQPSLPQPSLSQPSLPQAEIPIITIEQPYTAERKEKHEALDHGKAGPTPTQEQRKFSAPRSEWDATRSAPPLESKPEASNFPTAQYEFSESKELFHAPPSYPEPPKDMYYEVPKEKPKPQEKPKPIFPWEKENYMPKPTRVFADDFPLPPLPLSTTSSAEPTEMPAPIPFLPQANVWDYDQNIDRYVRTFMESKIRRSRPWFQTQAMPEDVMSPGAGRSARQESLILTDFPSADDRPSLPVTPAPIRRPTFWGGGRDDEGNLPAAEGVPDQADWVCPQCGFVSSSPVAFYRPSRKSSATASSTWRPQAHRTESSEYPPLPPHLSLHRTSSSSQSAISSTSTAVAPPTSTRTAFTKDVSEQSSAVPSAMIWPEEGGLEHGGAAPADGQQTAKTLPEHKPLSELWQQLS